MPRKTPFFPPPLTQEHSCVSAFSESTSYNCFTMLIVLSKVIIHSLYWQHNWLKFSLSPVVLVFCIFHHAHILDRNSNQSLLAKISLVFGCVASCGAFVAGNCNVSATGCRMVTPTQTILTGVKYSRFEFSKGQEDYFLVWEFCDWYLIKWSSLARSSNSTTQ